MRLLLIAWEWRPRVLLRAQLREEGHDVFAAASWEEAELLLLTRAVRPEVVVFDLDAEPNPPASLRTLVHLVPPDRIVVLTTSAALSPDTVRAIGPSHVLARAFSVRDVIDAVRAVGEPRRAS
jgi:DNA-binding NarL/FixJ family response regulator